MKVKMISAVCAILLLLTGCAAKPIQPNGALRYETTFLDVFDTVTTLTGYSECAEDFDAVADQVYTQLLRYHQLFDIYHGYDNMNNLKKVNDMAAMEPVEVEACVMDLLSLCKEMEAITEGTVNVAMGSVLLLWHEARVKALEDPSAAELPDTEALNEAGRHTCFNNVILDQEKKTVYFTDSELKLDVGAVAKGYAVQRVGECLPEGYLLNVGGDVYCSGPKPNGESWGVGLQSPDKKNFLQVLQITEGAVVTSGDYQRYFTVDGIPYHHIIDPTTWMPGTLWRSVSVICSDSGIADALSTALFLLPIEEGQRLLEHYDAEAIWLSADGAIYRSPGFPTEEDAPF